METTHNDRKSRLNEFIDNPEKSLWKLALPMMFGMMVHAIYMLTDTAFIGNLVGNDALSALGYVFPYMFIIMGLTFGLGAGSTAVIARYIGKKDKESADSAAGQMMLIGAIISLTIITLTYFFKENIFTIQSADPNIIRLSMSYFTILSSGAVFLIFSMFIRSILSGEGDNLFPMKALGVGTVLNIILDPIFIYYLDKVDRGIEGAALATVLSQFVVCIILIYYLIYKKRSYIDFSLKYLKFNPVVIKEILKIGIPSSLSMVIMAMGAFVFNLILNSDDAVAAFNIGSRIEHLFFLPIISISSSLVTLVGMFSGANRVDLIRSIIRYGLKFSLTFSFFCLLFFFFISKHIIPFFTSSENIAQISIGYFSIVSFSYPFVTIGMTSSRIMQGLGKGLPVLFITLVRVILINAPLGWYLRRVLEMPIEFVWYCILFSSFVAATLSMLWMRNIIKQQENKIPSLT